MIQSFDESGKFRSGWQIMLNLGESEVSYMYVLTDRCHCLYVGDNDGN